MVFLLTMGSLVAQKKEVTITAEREGVHLIFKAENHTRSPQKLTFRLTKIKGMSDNKRQVVKTINPGAMVDLKKVRLTGGKYSYQYEKETEIPKAYLKQHTVPLEDFSKINQGIVVFNKDGCGRCSYTTNFLIENGIPFRIIDITKNRENLNLMFELLEKNGVKESIRTPVIMQNGVLSHSHEDLMSFLEQME